MANYYGFVEQGDDNANKLKAHAVNSDGDIHYYNIVHAAGGDDKIFVDMWFEGQGAGAELYGEDGDDKIKDGENKDTLSGGAGDDTIRSHSGQDVIDGGEGFDTLCLGMGTLDTVTFSSIERLLINSIRVEAFDIGVFEEIGCDFAQTNNREAHITFVQQTALSGVNFSDKGRFWLNGSDFNDSFDVSDSDARIAVRGKGGDDTILAASAATTLLGGTGNDALTGSAFADRLNGGNGDDTIYGGDGDDRIVTRLGNDLVFAGDGNDLIGASKLAASDTKWLYGQAGNDKFDGFKALKGVEINLDGGQGDDTLKLRGSIDGMTLRSVEILELEFHVENDFEVRSTIKAGAELLNSFQSITASSQNPADIWLTSGGEFTWKKANAALFGDIHGSRQGDEIDMSNSGRSWAIHGNSGNDILKLGDGGEIWGDGGNDTIIGGIAWGDNLNGGDGNDVIDGRGNSDELTGGNGSDTFVFQTNSGRDSIYDFEVGKSHDIIDLSAVKTIGDYDDLVEHHIKSGSIGLTIDLGDGDKIYVSGLYKQDLDESFFIF
jgi:Ca2+-binding RTX toxin-like protein